MLYGMSHEFDITHEGVQFVIIVLRRHEIIINFVSHILDIISDKQNYGL